MAKDEDLLVNMGSSGPYADEKNIYVNMTGNLYPKPISRIGEKLDIGRSLAVVDKGLEEKIPLPADASKCLLLDNSFVSQVARNT